MACSTAARSGMRVISSRSFPSSLQFLCCRRLRQFVPDHLSVLDTVNMPPGLRAFLANNMTWLLQVPQVPGPNATAPPSKGYVCPICLPLKAVFEGCDENDESDEEDVQINRVALNLTESSDSDSSTSEDAGESQRRRLLHRDTSRSIRSAIYRDSGASSNFEQLPSSSSSGSLGRSDDLLTSERRGHVAGSRAIVHSPPKKVKFSTESTSLESRLQSFPEETSEVDDVENDEQTLALLGVKRKWK